MGLNLDSSILIAGERRRFDLPAFLRAHGGEGLYICAITASELLHGVERAETRARRDARSQFVEDLLGLIPVIDFDLSIARTHAALWARLEQEGERIGAHDLQIAATSVVTGHTLATLNRAEFSRIPGLRLASVSRFISA